MNLKLDSSGDLVIDKGAGRVSGTEYVAQLIANRLKTLKGEWALDTSIGLPWYTDMLKRNPDVSFIYQTILTAIRNTYGVVDVTFLQLRTDPHNRKLYVDFKVSSLFGPVQNVMEV